MLNTQEIINKISSNNIVSFQRLIGMGQIENLTSSLSPHVNLVTVDVMTIDSMGFSFLTPNNQDRKELKTFVEQSKVKNEVMLIPQKDKVFLLVP